MGLRTIWITFCIFFFSFVFWLYGIGFQYSLIGSGNMGEVSMPIAHWDYLNDIRVDDFTMVSCIVASLSLLFLGFEVISYVRRFKREYSIRVFKDWILGEK